MIGLLAALTVAAQLFLAVVAIAALARVLGHGGTWNLIVRLVTPDANRLAWLVATVATASSLYMSEVRHFEPCVLCWYQRIAMYPLVLVLGVGAVRGDAGAWRYAMPSALLGAGIATYHYQLERFPDQETLSCSSAVPCTTIWFEQLGYITIPMMALTAFALVATILTIGRHRGQEVTSEA